MEQQDEVFESIPWERFGEMQRGFDWRWVFVAVAAVAVGFVAFGIRSGPDPTPAVAAPVVVATTLPISTTTEVAEVTTTQGLWADEPQTALDMAKVERFAVGLLGSHEGVAIAAVRAEEPSTGEGRAEVQLLLTGSDGTVETVRLAVEVDEHGEIVRWYPLATRPLDIRRPSPGAEPPPDVMAQLIRQAARWGTKLDVLGSGLSDDRWWAELLVELPSGMKVPVMVWEE